MRNQAETLFASAVPASPNYLANSSFVESGQRAAFTQLQGRCVTVFALSAPPYANAGTDVQYRQPPRGITQFSELIRDTQACPVFVLGID